MVRNLAVSLIVKSLILIVCSCFSANAQRVVPTIDVETYDRVIDIVMPLEIDKRPFEFGYVVRVKPAFETEFSISIIGYNGTVELTKRWPSGGNLFSHLSRMIDADGAMTADKLAESVQLTTKTRLFTDAEFDALRKQFRGVVASVLARSERSLVRDKSKNSNVNKSGTVILDGTTYEVSFVSPSRERLGLWAYDYSIDSKHFDSRVAPWVKDLQTLFQSKTK